MLIDLLIVEDDKNTREGLLEALESNYRILTASNEDEALKLMKLKKIDIIITDLKMGNKNAGLTILDKAIHLYNDPICILLTAYATINTAVDAMKRGAYDFLTKPIDLEKLELVLKKAIHSRYHNHQKKIQNSLKFNDESDIIGTSSALQIALNAVKKVAPTKSTVLLYGETGTGKELFAQMLHKISPRYKNPFIAVHCASLPCNLLESELFVH